MNNKNEEYVIFSIKFYILIILLCVVIILLLLILLCCEELFFSYIHSTHQHTFVQYTPTIFPLFQHSTSFLSFFDDSYENLV